MHFDLHHAYHLYNRGNNKVKIFFEERNYAFFLNKIRKEWLSFCDIINYSMMPNHFHLIIAPKVEGCQLIHPNPNKTCIQKLSKAIGKTLSSYTQAINKQNNTVGNLFTKKTKAKCLTDPLIRHPKYSSRDYLITCFHYVHLNPTRAGLVNCLHEWPYSSWLDYAGLRNGTLCNKELGMRLTGLRESDFKNEGRIILLDEILEEIW